MIDTKQLTIDLIEAREQAGRAIHGMEDSGTCNFDSVFLATGKGKQLTRRSAKVEAAVKAAGCSCFHKGYGMRRGYVINVGLGGQGATRTKAAETVEKLLRAKGWTDIGMWYQMD